MKKRFLKIILRNVTFSAILTPFVINSEALLASFLNSLRNDGDFQVKFWAVILVSALLFGLVRIVIQSTAGIKQELKMTNVPHFTTYTGWPLHTSPLGAVLVGYIFASGWYLDLPNPTLYLSVFVVVYVILGVLSWIWVKSISSKNYVPEKKIADDDLIRSLETYRMIKVCICRKRLAGYIPLTRFSVSGGFIYISLLLLISIIMLLEENTDGKPSMGGFFLVVSLFYVVQIIVRCIVYLTQEHSFKCALRRAYCESI